MRWQRVVDIGLVAWMTGSSLVLAATVQDSAHVWHAPDALGYALICAAHLPLLWRRRAPIAVLLIVSGVSVLYLTLGYYQSVTTFALALAIFSVSAYRPRRVALPYALLATAVILYEQRLTVPGMTLFGLAIATVIALVAWAFGDNNFQLTERGTRLAALTEQLRREQEERARRAVSEEQGRIARELHDVVAHHMSVISVQAGLGRYVLESDPQTTRSTLDVIASTAHEALAEMRRMLTVLREENAPFDAAPGLKRLPELIERVRSAGATVDLEVTGTPSPLAPGLDLCVYRVIQESLTNVLKHADPPRATVKMRWDASELRVTVTDEGRPRAQAETDAVPHGLIGMRERSRIYGGHINAGHKPEGGFEVVLTLPTKEPML